MSIETNAESVVSDEWSILTYHDWNGQEKLEVTLGTALKKLNEVDEQAVVYDYIDVDWVTSVINPDVDSRGAHELHFYCESYEISIHADGTIAYRPQT